MKKSLSVIIPVYNCERFVAKAIESALTQPEVTEVVVVDDGSQDKSLAICQAIQLQDNRVKIFQHPNGVNKGRSASRNLALQKATGNYIAFLDADDYYLENRFTNDFKLFQSDENCDGVYNAIGAHFYRETTKLEFDQINLFTVDKHIIPEALFEVLLIGKNGHFSIDGLTIKKTVLDKVGYFNEDLVVSEDTELIWKMAIKCQLFTGIISHALAVRGVHESNVYNRRDLYEVNDLKLYESMYEWSSKNNLDLIIIESFLERIWILQYRKHQQKYKYFFYWVKINSRVPKLLFSYLGVKYFPLLRYLQKKHK